MPLNEYQSFGWGYGLEGIRDPVQWSQNTATVNPISRYNSKFHPDSELKKLPDDLLNFLQLYDQVILISFGTTFQPSLEEMINLAHAVGTLKNVGCIASVKDSQY